MKDTISDNYVPLIDPGLIWLLRNVDDVSDPPSIYNDLATYRIIVFRGTEGFVPTIWANQVRASIRKLGFEARVIPDGDYQLIVEVDRAAVLRHLELPDAPSDVCHLPAQDLNGHLCLDLAYWLQAVRHGQEIRQVDEWHLRMLMQRFFENEAWKRWVHEDGRTMTSERLTDYLHQVGASRHDVDRLNDLSNGSCSRLVEALALE